MLQTVTAIIVVRNGSARVQRTLESLRAQTRRPDSVVVIETGSDGDVTPAVAAFVPTQHLATKEKLSFPAAVAAAVRALDAPVHSEQWLWLLGQDTAPEPAALEQLLAVGEVSPSVAVAGPKLVEWDDRARLRGFGVTMTRFGATVPLVEDELDQGQHDGTSDVLGVHEAGMLVRHSVYTEAGGLDQALPVVDGGLDFCVRVRLAGHRVVVAPGARLAIGGDGVVGPRLSQRTGAERVGHRQRRVAQLHRRMAYAPGAALVLHWLTLVPLGIARAILWLIGKRPGAVGGELAAAFQAAFADGHLAAARRNVAHSKRAGWAVIAPLRLPPSELRRRRMLAREAAMTAAHGEWRELDFFGSGGGWVLLAALAGSVAISGRLLGASTLGGGGLLPLNDSVGHLWASVGWGWRDVGVGFVGPSDPFQAVLALLGTLTFWQPSLSLVVVWFAAMPLGAIGAWLLAARFTRRAGIRAFFGLAWAFAPPLLAALADGRPAAVLAHVLLPWLIFAAVTARRSWSAAGATALLAAAVAACAPSLVPALAIAWLLWTAASGRSVFRALFVPLPAIALFLPLALAQLAAGTPVRIFADPGVPVPGDSASTWQLMLGFPGGATGGWNSFADSLGWPAGVVAVVLTVLVAPLALLALAALFLRPSVRTAGALLGAFLGLATALLCAQTALQVSGDHAVGLWTGSGLSLYWLGLTGAALFALAGLGRFSVTPAWVASIGALLAIVPLALVGVFGGAAVIANPAGQLPAYVIAEATSQPRTATLVVTPVSQGTVTAGIVHGSGDTLDQQSTVASTDPELSPSDSALAHLAVNLVSRSGYDASDDLSRFGIGFVFLHTGASPGLSARSFGDRAATALDGNALLARVGTTAAGTLWSTAADVTPIAVPADPGGWQQPLIVLMLVVVFGVFALLAIPIGNTAAPRRRPRRPKNGRSGPGGAAPARGATDGEASDQPDADAEVGAPAALEPQPDEGLEPAYAAVGGHDEEA
ncbi:glycosyltransferase family 2 protein [Gryllotalpicola protaetiae]|uniref:Glycosyltransferase family 2 protein n=1 Tax=Gryllotalpicola protaetiae TaxID=2419771 RepID=A0A387BP87_9MICO|nr:glycosyltransferase [Gryllotalpicola protaetiae]AYG04292.1 glycosyltransferase family 2 protein [Gryllotalpicola protaetiae]